MTDHGADGADRGADDLVAHLYGELDGPRDEEMSRRVVADPELRRQVEELRRVRALFTGLVQEEPPSRISAQLLVEAARRRRSPGASSARSVGWSRIGGWFASMAQRPAIAAMATMVLIAGVAGTLYLRRGDELLSARGPAQAPPPPSPGSGPAVGEREEGRSAPASSAAGESEAQREGGSASVGPLEPEDDRPVAPTGQVADERERGAAPRKSTPGPASRRDGDAAKKAKPAPKDDLASGGADGVSAGTVGGISEKSAVRSQSVESTAETRAPARSGTADRGAAAAEAPPPSPAEVPSASPGPTSDATRGRSGSTSGGETAEASARELHRRAVAAATGGRCDEVRSIARRIWSIDPAYHDGSFRGDRRLTSCLSSSKAKARP